VRKRRTLRTALVGAAVGLLLVAMYGLLTSVGVFPGAGEPPSGQAPPVDAAASPPASAFEGSAPPPPAPTGAERPEPTSTSRDPRTGGDFPSGSPGSSQEVPTTGSATRSLSRRFRIPVAGVRPEELVDTYTQARSAGRSHDAIDIAAPRGTPVIAVADGAVLKLFLSEQGGITLYQIDPDQRTLYYYAHLDRYAPAIAEGLRVRQGDTIGYVGDTGNAGAGNFHLHFEISTTEDPTQYWGGTPTNPYPLLRDAVAPPR
jgi:murein DD-endopeptidase MepM/ murein hydrolase activator NlpD